MLDLVPFAGARRQLADADGKAELIGQFLQFQLPQPHARAVAAAAIGCNHERFGVGITRFSHVFPPGADGIGGKGRVIVNADADPANIVATVIDPVRCRASQPGNDKIMDADLFGSSLPVPFTPGIFATKRLHCAEIANQFLRLCVHRRSPVRQSRGLP